MAIALNHSKATGTAKLILIGIANHDGDGGAWPSLATLSRYAGGVNRRNIQRALDRLEQLGEIKRGKMLGGNADTPDHLRPNLYIITVRCPAYCDRTSQHRDNRRALISMLPDDLLTGVAAAPPGGDSATPPVAAAPPEPSFNQTTRLKEKTQVKRVRAEKSCAQGHDLIDDRHCVYGCLIAELVDA